MTDRTDGTIRVTITLDLDDDGLAHIHAADALLHLIQWFQHDAITVDATLHIPSQGTLTTATRPAKEGEAPHSYLKP